jgi:hypothetical protein
VRIGYFFCDGVCAYIGKGANAYFHNGGKVTGRQRGGAGQRGKKGYHCYCLLFYDGYDYVTNTIAREKEIEGWTRKRKLELIASFNP